MSLIGLDIVIVGGGIGGLTAAIALAQRGARVSVLEQAAEISEVGAGIQISPNGLCVLRALGLAPEIALVGVQAQAVELRDYRVGRLVTRLDLGRLEESQKYYFLHRADLIALLLKAAIEAGVSVVTGAEVTDIKDGPRPAVVTSLETRSADLVIAADGLHSLGRKTLLGTTAPFFTRHTAWRAVVPNSIGHPDVARVHMGPKKHVVSYPLRGGDFVNLVAVAEQQDWSEESWSLRGDPGQMMAKFSEFCEETKCLMSAAQGVGKWGLFRHPVAHKWHGERVVLLGDAAHPTLPFMAQGAVMAIEDAWVLADELAQSEDIQTGLASYQMTRHDRVSKIVDTASKNAWRYHLKFPPLRGAAHMVMRLGGAVAPGKMMGQFDWIYRHDVTAG